MKKSRQLPGTRAARRSRSSAATRPAEARAPRVPGGPGLAGEQLPLLNLGTKAAKGESKAVKGESKPPPRESKRSKRASTAQQPAFLDEVYEAERDKDLPTDRASGVAYYRELLTRHHAAMLAGDEPRLIAIDDEAHRLAVKMNGGRPGILADDDAPGEILERDTAAAKGAVPLWGQRGDFVVHVEVPGVPARKKQPATGPQACDVRVEWYGLLGGYGGPGGASFAAHVVDPHRPFISETGYRSFLGYQVLLATQVARPVSKHSIPQVPIEWEWEGSETALSVSRWVIDCITHNIATELNGRLLELSPEYVPGTADYKRKWKRLKGDLRGKKGKQSDRAADRG